jgi:aryl carrier-like protein
LEYHGRLDQQVKLRGYRIELGEIENCLQTCDGVVSAAVLLRQKDGNPQLVAYYSGKATEPDIRDYLSSKLPAYMVPEFYVALETMPLGSSGKADRKALALLDPIPNVVVNEALETDFQLVLAQLWTDLLSWPIETIGLNSHFFRIGGDSIKAIQLVARLRKKGWDLQLSDVMRYPWLIRSRHFRCLKFILQWQVKFCLHLFKNFSFTETSLLKAMMIS